MQNIEALERRLWAAADQLRANSGLGSNEYFMPVLGVLFLRHASTRYAAALIEVEASLPTRDGKKRTLAKDDFTKRRSIFLRPESQYDYLLALPGDSSMGKAVSRAMDLIEKDYDGLKGILPRNYEGLSDELLSSLVRIFNDETLRKAAGDVFGRIYEYFLMKFSMQGAHDNGEFFTPPSIVQTIVNVIEPAHGKVFDPACGSGGMFVQTSHFLEGLHKDVTGSVTFYGQEKNDTTIRIAKMNLAVHGLEGQIIRGNTFYEDHHEMLGKADFVMANPPFNVDSIDADKIKKDPRLPFGLPGVNKAGTVSNGNYLWISYFYSYLNAKGRAGFVMSSQASSAGHGEMEVRRKLVQSGHVDVMIAIRPNFFYTRSVPCELWFFDKGKPKEKQDKILMIDARNTNRKVTRKIYDFSPEQMSNIAAIVWLYRDETGKYLQLIESYFKSLLMECEKIPTQMEKFGTQLIDMMTTFDKYAGILKEKGSDTKGLDGLQCDLATLREERERFNADRKKVLGQLKAFSTDAIRNPLSTNFQQIKAGKTFEAIAGDLRELQNRLLHIGKVGLRAVNQLQKLVNGSEDLFDKTVRKQLAAYAGQLSLPKDEEDEGTLLSLAVYPLYQGVYYYKQIHWLQDKFPEAAYRDVEGLVCLVSGKEIEKNDWSLTPGRYVGIAPIEDAEDFNFNDRMREIHTELNELIREANKLSTLIQCNFEELL